MVSDLSCTKPFVNACGVSYIFFSGGAEIVYFVVLNSRGKLRCPVTPPTSYEFFTSKTRTFFIIYLDGFSVPRTTGFGPEFWNSQFSKGIGRTDQTSLWRSVEEQNSFPTFAVFWLFSRVKCLRGWECDSDKFTVPLIAPRMHWTKHQYNILTLAQNINTHSLSSNYFI